MVAVCEIMKYKQLLNVQRKLPLNYHPITTYNVGL